MAHVFEWLFYQWFVWLIAVPLFFGFMMLVSMPIFWLLDKVSHGKIRF